jgi:hypothetical protein
MYIRDNGSYEFPAEHAITAAWVDLADQNHQISTEATVREAIRAEYGTFPGKNYAVLAAALALERVEQLRAIHAESFGAIGVELSFGMKRVKIGSSTADVEPLWPIVPDLQDAELFASYLENLGAEVMGGDNEVYLRFSHLVAGNLLHQVTRLEELKSCYEAPAEVRTTDAEDIGMNPFAPLVSADQHLRKHLDDFLTILPAYSACGIDNLQAFSELKERVVSAFIASS